MPIFEYNCDRCNYTFDRLVISQNSEVNCPLCQGEVKKLMSTFAVQSRGSGTRSPAPQRPMCTSCG
jgi:putative FmdB family regulatory protein